MMIEINIAHTNLDNPNLLWSLITNFGISTLLPYYH